jgi:hypothetical protein
MSLVTNVAAVTGAMGVSNGQYCPLRKLKSLPCFAGGSCWTHSNSEMVLRACSTSS